MTEDIQWNDGVKCISSHRHCQIKIILNSAVTAFLQTIIDEGSACLILCVMKVTLHQDYFYVRTLRKLFLTEDQWRILPVIKETHDELR